jgi:hypothetical protein
MSEVFCSISRTAAMDTLRFLVNAGKLEAGL